MWSSPKLSVEKGGWWCELDVHAASCCFCCNLKAGFTSRLSSQRFPTTTPTPPPRMAGDIVGVLKATGGYKFRLKIAFSGQHLACRLLPESPFRCSPASVAMQQTACQPASMYIIWRRVGWHVFFFQLHTIYVCTIATLRLLAYSNHKVKINIPAPDGPGSIPFT